MIFDYPEPPEERRHGPANYAAYKHFRPWLRDEFDFMCVFCLVREQWGRVRGTFNLDHFLPVAHHPEGRLRYDNLLYCCAACNDAKRDRILPDPCRVLVAGAVQVREDGLIEARSPDARRIVRVLGLNDREAREFRSLWVGIAALADDDFAEFLEAAARGERGADFTFRYLVCAGTAPQPKHTCGERIG